MIRARARETKREPEREADREGEEREREWKNRESCLLLRAFELPLSTAKPAADCFERQCVRQKFGAQKKTVIVLHVASGSTQPAGPTCCQKRVPACSVLAVFRDACACSRASVYRKAVDCFAVNTRC